MSFSKISAAAGVLAFAAGVAAHGTVTGASIDGVYYEGYYANFQYMSDPPAVIGWSIPEDLSNGYIAPDAYGTSDIICHVNATNGQKTAAINAGEEINIQWTTWPDSHHGPVLTYMANCGGDCTTVDKTTLEWFKIDEAGLIDDTTLPGTWGSDQLIANNNSWTAVIPSDIASGSYVIRNEIIALHSAGESDGAQNYPFCLNLEVTGTGTATPSGVLGTALYSETDAGILVNIYSSLASYDIPGPTLYSGATATVSQGAGATSAAAATTTAAAVATTSAAATSAAVSTSAVVSSYSAAATSSAVASSSTSVAVAPSAVAVAIASTTSSAAGSSTTSTTSMPAGTTLQDLLSWLYTYIESVVGSTSTSTKRSLRSHARAFNPRA